MSTFYDGYMVNNNAYVQAERDDQGSKVSDFFARSEDMFIEMNWQKKLR